MAAISSPLQSQAHFLQCRNSPSSSIGAVTPALFQHRCSSTSFLPSDDHIYSSLKDLLPSAAAVNSPIHKPALPRFDICIRNRLVKQAAWAYLQPMSTSPASSGGSFLRRVWARVASVINHFFRHVIRALDGTLRLVRISTV